MHISRIRKPEFTKGEMDKGAVDWYKDAFHKKRNDVADRSHLIGKDAETSKQKNTPLGHCVASFDLAEAVWIQMQYGMEAFTDPDFLRYYRKARDQNFLPAI